MKMEYIESPNRATSSPEFEFRMPPLEQNLLPADELISKGVLLPLHLLPKPKPKPKPEEPELKSMIPTIEREAITASRRWTDIFKKPDKKKEATTTTRAKLELNINLWPFSRSHSAGPTSSSRQKLPLKSSSAPCSRSNSVRRCTDKEKVKKSALNLNMNSCITGEVAEGNGSLFGLRALFATKKEN